MMLIMINGFQVWQKKAMSLIARQGTGWFF
jgi:hypothetical protein